MQNPDTQRWEVVEVLELIANLIATTSHHYEIYQSLQTDLAHPELYSKEQMNDMVENSKWHYDKLVELIDKRREAMRILKWIAVKYNSELHCILKHSIACYQFAQELWNVDMKNEDYMAMAEYTSKYMYECASKYLWVEVVTCGRCITDELSINESK